jgi:predicted DCC family thiol-disulfide oxidoreductase YuxK
MTEQGKDDPVIMFDGYCNFCSGSVLFIIRRDPGRIFRFVASQTDAGVSLREKYGLVELAEHSIILIREGKVYSKSGAALRIARQMRFPWPALFGLTVLPVAFLDFFYDIIARNRYRIYGKRETCFLPDKDIRDRFL